MTVDGTGSSWENSGDVLFGGSACVSCFGSPTLNIQNHGTVSVGGQLLLGEIGAIRSDGTGNLAGNVKYAGTISPGNLPGRLRIDGNLTNNVGNFQNGKLQFALASTTSFAKLEVTGNVSLGGMLEVIRLGGHNPTAGQSYDLLDWGGSLTGTFSTIQLPPLAAGLDWNTSQLYVTGVISVVGAATTGRLQPKRDRRRGRLRAVAQWRSPPKRSRYTRCRQRGRLHRVAYPLR